MGYLKVMSGHGDQSLAWDATDHKSVETARERFTKLLRLGGTAFKSEPGKVEGTQLTQFDPKADEIIIIPQVSGGSL
jgi:hypothetical protein